MAQSQSAEKPRRGKAFKWIISIIFLLIAVILIGGFYANYKLRQSLPLLEGELQLAGISTGVSIDRDSLGVPTISSTDRADIAFATGFVHAQERFFQMDLLRRRSAGELAELFGPPALKIDRAARLHRFRARTEKAIRTLDAAEKSLLSAYKNGVNAGLKNLAALPFEYILLGEKPAPWREEDSFLCIQTMYFTLQSANGQGESDLSLMHDLLPPSLFKFLAPAGTKWDAALDGSTFPAPPLPAPGKYFEQNSNPSNKSTSKVAATQPFFLEMDKEIAGAFGSNNWAVSGEHSTTGGAIVCNDMHLMINIPNIWYRLSLVIESENTRQVTGVSLPGTPFIVTGSNGEVAWGFTNSYGDWGDLIVLETDSTQPDLYKTPAGMQGTVRYHEMIRVKGAAPDTLLVEETIWGPVVDKDYLGRKRAYRWVAHTERGVNLNLAKLEQVHTIEEALAVAKTGGIPAQNFTTGDKDGNIGWTICGAIPRRTGKAGRYPQSWADGSNGWHGWLSPEEYPQILNPESGRIWTANARAVGGAMGDKFYDYFHYALGARAQQIRDQLLAKDKFKPADMIHIQRDHRAIFLTRWQEFLVKTLDSAAVAGNPGRQEFQKAVANWQAVAAPGSVGYRLVKNFRRGLANRIFDPLLAPLKAKDERFSYINMVMAHHEQAMWDLVTQQPEYLLPPGYDSWKQLLLAQVDAVVKTTGLPLADHPWGEENKFTIQHPFSKSIKGLSAWLDIPAQSLPGGVHMPLLQTKRRGGLIAASERFAVTPGREDEAYFHMPGGQSGHPMSPFYNKGHAAWVNGDLTPFLPGETVYRMQLKPAN